MNHWFWVSTRLTREDPQKVYGRIRKFSLEGFLATYRHFPADRVTRMMQEQPVCELKLPPIYRRIFSTLPVGVTRSGERVPEASRHE